MNDSELETLSDDELEYVVKFAREQEVIYNVSQKISKILINSLYGALGNAGFRFYDVRLAEAITTGGQLSIRWIERKLNEFMNKLCETKDADYISYIDTDSVYMSVQKFVEKMCKKKGIAESDKSTAEWVDLLDNFAKNICEPYIAKAYQEMADYMNAYEQRMFMDREVIADCGFWTSKKRYALRVWDNEGKRKYNDKGELDYKLKIMGLETQKSSTPPFASLSLKKSIDVILMGNESKLHDYVKTVLDSYPKQDYSEIASVISVNNLEKYSDTQGHALKGSSAQVKASLAFNNLAKNHAAVDPIKSGEKVQMLILKQPNPTHAEKIAYPSGEVLPDDFDIDFGKWIDYRAMSQDHFLSPLQSMCDAIGWETEKRTKLSNVLDI